MKKKRIGSATRRLSNIVRRAKAAKNAIMAGGRTLSRRNADKAVSRMRSVVADARKALSGICGSPISGGRR